MIIDVIARSRWLSRGEVISPRIETKATKQSYVLWRLLRNERSQ